MRLNVQEFLADAVARCLNRRMLALLPAHRRAWGHALIAEQHEIASRRERLTWAAGGIRMSFQRIDTPHIQPPANVGRGSRVRRSLGSCRFAQFNAVAVHPLVMRVRADPHVFGSPAGHGAGFFPSD